MSVANINLWRDFSIRKKLKVQFPLDPLNPQNRPQFSDLDPNPFNSKFEKCRGRRIQF